MKRKPHIRLAAVTAAAVLAIPALAWAGTAVFASFFGSTDRGTLVSLSDHGNVLGFAGPTVPGAEYEHLKVGALSEGYVLCYRHPDTNAYVNAFDLGATESGFGAAGAPSTGATWMAVTRHTSDGLLALKQGFVFEGKEKRLMVQTTVINSNPFPIHNVVLRRQADFDVDHGGADGWAGGNLWARTSRESVFAWNEPSLAAGFGKEAHGMLMTHRSTHIHKSGVYTYPPATARTAKVTEKPLDSSCNPPAKSTPVTSPADDGGTIQVNIGTIPAAADDGWAASAAVGIWYQRI